MTKKEFVDELKMALLKEFKGKDFKLGVVEAFVEKWFAEKIGCNTNEITAYYNRNWINFCYKKSSNCVFNVCCKKAKGDIHHPWYGKSYYDWNFKDFDVYANFLGTIEEEIKKIEEYNVKKECDKNKKIEIAENVATMIKEKYPELNKYDLREVTEILYNKRYDFFDED